MHPHVPRGLVCDFHARVVRSTHDCSLVRRCKKRKALGKASTSKPACRYTNHLSLPCGCGLRVSRLKPFAWCGRWDKRFFVLAPAPQGVAGQLSYYKRPDDWQKGAQPKARPRNQNHCWQLVLPPHNLKDSRGAIGCAQGVIQLDGAQLLLSEVCRAQTVARCVHTVHE